MDKTSNRVVKNQTKKFAANKSNSALSVEASHILVEFVQR